MGLESFIRCRYGPSEDGPIGRVARRERWARANLAEATIFIDLVILAIDVTDLRRMSTAGSRRKKNAGRHQRAAATGRAGVAAGCSPRKQLGILGEAPLSRGRDEACSANACKSQRDTPSGGVRCLTAPDACGVRSSIVSR